MRILRILGISAVGIMIIVSFGLAGAQVQVGYNIFEEFNAGVLIVFTVSGIIFLNIILNTVIE